LQTVTDGLAVQALVSSGKQEEVIVSEGWEKPFQASGLAVTQVKLQVGVMPAWNERAAWR